MTSAVSAVEDASPKTSEIEELVVLPRAEFDRLAALAAEAEEDDADSAAYDSAMAALADGAEFRRLKSGRSAPPTGARRSMVRDRSELLRTAGSRRARRFDCGLHQPVDRIRVAGETGFDPELSEEAKNFPDSRALFDAALNEIASADRNLRRRRLRKETIPVREGRIVRPCARIGLSEKERVARALSSRRKQEDA